MSHRCHGVFCFLERDFPCFFTSKKVNSGRVWNHKKKSTLPAFVRQIIMERKQKLYHNKDRSFERRTLNSLVKKHGRGVNEESDLMNYDDRPPAHLKGKAIGLWYRDRQVRRKADDQRPPLTKQEKAMMSMRKHFYRIELPEDKEYHINKLLGEIRRNNPSTLPFFEDQDISKKGKKGKAKQDELPLFPNYQPSTSRGASISGNTTSELRGQVEEKYKHVEDSAFKRKFLSSISGTLEEKIEAAMLSNYKLMSDPVQDAFYKKEMIRKMKSQNYQNMLEARKKLPAFEMEQEILDMINNHQIVVISGETGCGKTTQVPQFILDDEISKGRGSQTFIMVTQPRRISAISIAERVAQERDEHCGNPGSSVGYQIRLERELPRKQAAMLYCTAGILPEIMQSDPILSGVSHVVMDEIHERSMVSDFLLAILKDVTKKRKDLKLILMSATLNAEKFSDFFDGAPILHIPGFTYPVREYYLEDVFSMTGFRPGQNSRGVSRPTRQEAQEFENIMEPYVRTLRRSQNNTYPSNVLNLLKDPELEGVNYDVIFSLLQHISRQRPGAVLVFLPGWDTISALHKTLTKSKFFNNGRFQILPLHSMLPTVSQRVIFDRPREGVRKIVLATNIAETSITIDDVVYVIDCGKTKMSNFDVKENVATLKPEWISLANAKQRRGRAGRVQEGVCYHLYSRAREGTFQDYPLPEIQRTRLDEVVLKGKMLQLGQIAPFLQKLLDPPDPASVQLSLKMLRYIDALDDDEHLTPLGYHLAKLPLDPQIGKLLLMASIFSCVDPVFTVAASLGFKDAFYCPMNMEKEVDKRRVALAQGAHSDYFVLINAMKGWEEAEANGYPYDFCRENFLTNTTLQLLREMKDQFTRHMEEMRFISSKDSKAEDSNLNSKNVALVNAVIASGLYPNVGVIKQTKWNNRMNKHHSSILTPDDGKVNIHPKSVNSNSPGFDAPFIMYYHKLKGASLSVNLHDTAQVYPLPMIFFAHDMKSSMKQDLPDYSGKNKKHTKHRVDKKPTEILTVRDCLNFECKPSTAKLIKELRGRLDMLLAHKLSHPGTTNWGTEEGNILLAIIELITNEDKRGVGDDYSEEEDDDQADDNFVDKI